MASAAIEVVAQTRKQQGRGASRRLRHSGKVPGIVYGGGAEPTSIEIDHNSLFHQLKQEKFHASILSLKVDERSEQVLLRSFNMHPWKPAVEHIDFQRVSANEKIHMKVPLHFINADVSPAVKLGGAIVSHVLNELDIVCLPADLPEYIEVDLSEISTGHSIHVNDLKMPSGVEAAGKYSDNPSVATAQVPRALAAEEEVTGEAPPASAVPAAKQPDKPEAAKPDAKAGGDKGGDKGSDKGGKK